MFNGKIASWRCKFNHILMDSLFDSPMQGGAKGIFIWTYWQLAREYFVSNSTLCFHFHFNASLQMRWSPPPCSLRLLVDSTCNSTLHAPTSHWGHCHQRLASPTVGLLMAKNCPPSPPLPRLALVFWWLVIPSPPPRIHLLQLKKRSNLLHHSLHIVLYWCRHSLERLQTFFHLFDSWRYWFRHWFPRTDALIPNVAPRLRRMRVFG